VTTRVALLGAIAITALVVGSVFSEDATPNAPTNVAGVPWGMRLAEFQKTRPNALCQITHARDSRRDPAGPSESGREQYDLEGGTVTTIRPVTFRATCEEPMTGPEAGQVLFLLEGNPPLFTSAYLTFQRPDYPTMRNKLIALYGPPHERDAPPPSWWQRTVGRWVGPNTVEAERLIWRGPSAIVTLSSAEYAHLGRKSGATTLLLSATRP
jgi:hypothetical protein